VKARRSAVPFFFVVQVQPDLALDDAHADSGNLAADRVFGEDPCGQEFADCQRQGDKAACDRRCARAPVGLEHVRVDPDSALPQLLKVRRRPHGTADEALDFLGAAFLTAAACLARRK